MNPAKIKLLFRWGLAILLGAAALFCLLTGFSTAFLGDGAEPGELRRAWSLHAAFLFEIAILFWLGSVVVLVGLKPGGFWRAVKGQQISSFKRWLHIVSLVVSLTAFVLSNPAVLVTKLQIHRCIKNGGQKASP